MTKLFILEEQCHFDLKQLWVQLQRCIASVDSYSDCQWNSNAYFTEYITAVRIMSSFSPGAYFILFIQLLGQVKKKKKKHDSHRRLLHFLAPPLFFYYLLWATFLWAKPTGITFTLYLVLLCLIQRKLKIVRGRLSASLFELRLKY